MTALGVEAGPAATCKTDKKIKNLEIGQRENREYRSRQDGVWHPSGGYRICS